MIEIEFDELEEEGAAQDGGWKDETLTTREIDQGVVEFQGSRKGLMDQRMSRIAEPFVFVVCLMGKTGVSYR